MSFAKTYFTNVVEGRRHSFNPGLFVDVMWNGGPVGNLTATKKPETFAELRGRYSIVDALTLYRQFLLGPFHHTPSI